MKFYNIDCHASVIADIKNLFNTLGHEVDHHSLSGHKWLFNWEPLRSNVLNEYNWKMIDQVMCDRFYDEQKNNLDKYDAFIVAYPTVFLKLFEKFNKPIIVISAIRYEFPILEGGDRLNWLNDSLKNNKNLILTANNEFDKKYAEKFTGVEWQWIPSVCDYIGEKWNKVHDKFVYTSRFHLEPHDKLIHLSQLGKHSWRDLYNFNGIIHFPYAISVMSAFEQNNAGVPLYLPSMEFMLKLKAKNVPVLSELVFPTPDPERKESVYFNEEWLKYSDFYNGTINCNFFNSFKDLIDKINDTSNRVYGQSNKPLVLEKWDAIIKTL